MRRVCMLRAAAVSIFLALAAGCGGYGGGTYDPPAGPSELFLKAILDGDEETSVVDGSATAVALLYLLGDGTLSFSVTGEAAWVGSVNGLHVHRGDPGINGPIEVDLLGGGATFDAFTKTAEDTISISAALASEMLTYPHYFYVNVHTTAAPNGLARAQLAPFTPVELHAQLRGNLEVPLVNPNARGGAALHVGADRMLSWVIAMSTPAIGTVNDAHIHLGNPGTPGPIVLDLGVSSATMNAAAGTLARTQQAPLSVLSRVLLDPGGYYVNAHTAAAPLGIARGQLAQGDVEVWAQLRGDKETTQVNPAARGGVGLSLQTFTTGRATLAAPPATGINAITEASLQLGGPGVNGAVLVDLKAGADYATSPPTASAEGAIAYDQALYARLIGNPGGFYVNLYTAGAPGGLVRGQLTQAPQTVTAVLSGANEVPVGDAGDTGNMTVLLTGLHACSFNLEMASPPAADVTAAHVHWAAAGFNGPIEIDLTGGATVLVGDTISGTTSFTGRTFTRLLADAASFYGNVHTVAEPDGVVRGQFTLLTEDSPPAGLAYGTPKVYVTGTPIDPNVPTSTGGAVTSYSVSPQLPAGMQIDPTTGVIFGTPAVAAAAQDYTVTAFNGAGNTTATVNITVNVGAPTNLAYTTPVVYVVGTAISPNQPTSAGGEIASYGVSPALPDGLVLDAVTGVISGTPTLAAAAADYVVTGTNVTNSTQATVNIRVDATLEAPSGLSYADAAYPTGYVITDNAPTVGGGPVATWSITPALPAGLSFSTTTGVISGKPTAVTAAADYTVTAENDAGSTQAVVNIEVTLGAPTNLTYSNDPNVGYYYPAQGYGIFSTMSPTVEGGDVETYSIFPALPSGLSINATTGVISGAPTGTSAQTTYTVTATNDTGDTTVDITITVQ